MQSLYKFTTTFMAVCILFLANMRVYTLMERQRTIYSFPPPLQYGLIT